MGKILGGTSMLNYMIYVRGSRHDFDGWEEMGCEGWGYDDVLPYFIKLENNQNQKFRSSGNYVISHQLSTQHAIFLNIYLSKMLNLKIQKNFKHEY